MSQPSDDSLKRQIEINEWTYNNKMDTVFVLQLIFLSVSIVCIVFYFKSVGRIGSTFAYYVAGITAALVAALIINRVFFTSARRDPRYWHRFRFNEDRQKVPSTINNSSFGDFWAAFMGAIPPNEPDASCPACPTPAAK